MKTLLSLFWAFLFRRLARRNRAINEKHRKARASALFHLDPP